MDNCICPLLSFSIKIIVCIVYLFYFFFYLYAQVFQNYQYLAINPMNVKACKENFMLMCAGG